MASTSTMTKVKLLDYWKTQIKLGVKYRRQYGQSDKWKLYKNMYRGFWDKKVVPVNLIYALGRSLIPQVYFRNPRVAVHPMKPGFAMHARMVERIANYLIRETGVKNQLKSQVLDCYLCGRGPGIFGYDSEWGYSQSFERNLYESDESLTNFNKKGEKIEYTDNVKPGMPWYLRSNALDFIVPWGTGRWESVQWYAMRKMRKTQDMKEDSKYENTSTLKGVYASRLESSVESVPEGTNRILDQDAISEWVELWEIHDKRTGMVFVLSLDHDKFLREDFDYLQVEGLPANVLGFNEDPDYFWWPPDARMIEVQQAEMNDIRTMARRHRHVALLKLLYNKDDINGDELVKLLDEDPKAAVGISGGASGDIRKAVALFQSHVPPDFSIAAREVREDIREVVGFSRNQMGSFEESSGRRTAHEAEIVRAASMIRIDERRDAMADHLEEVVRGYMRMVFTNWTQERVVDVVGEDGAKYWVRFTGPEIKGEMAYKINPEEAIPENRATRKLEAEQIMKIASGMPGTNMKYLLQEYARQTDWIDPAMLFPGEGPGRSPEKAMFFNDFNKMQQGGQSSHPGLRR